MYVSLSLSLSLICVCVCVSWYTSTSRASEPHAWKQFLKPQFSKLVLFSKNVSWTVVCACVMYKYTYTLLLLLLFQVTPYSYLQPIIIIIIAGNPLLVKAARYGRITLVNKLVGMGCDVNITCTRTENLSGKSPLHEAAFFGHAETVAAILGSGARVARDEMVQAVTRGFRAFTAYANRTRRFTPWNPFVVRGSESASDLEHHRLEYVEICSIMRAHFWDFPMVGE